MASLNSSGPIALGESNAHSAMNIHVNVNVNMRTKAQTGMVNTEIKATRINHCIVFNIIRLFPVPENRSLRDFQPKRD
jgi:hypothetical protein